jgi:hypothetical protein
VIIESPLAFILATKDAGKIVAKLVGYRVGRPLKAFAWGESGKPGSSKQKCTAVGVISPFSWFAVDPQLATGDNDKNGANWLR